MKKNINLKIMMIILITGLIATNVYALKGAEIKASILRYEPAPAEQGNTFDVWYTPDLPHNSSSKYAWKGVEGFPMESIIEQKSMGGTIKMKLLCTKVEKTDVKDDMFTLPEGYTVMTADEIKKQYGGK